jgi:two-component system sensor histidine kinase KdpD
MLFVRHRRSMLAVLRGLAAVALLTAAAYRLHSNSATAGFLYLIAVVLNCLDSGMVEAAIVSIAALGCLDYFFIDPVFTFTVADPVDVAALAAFLISSLVVTRLASSARREARTSRRERRNLEGLFELAQRLFGLDPLHLDPVRLLDTIRLTCGVKSAAFFEANTAGIYTSGPGAAGVGAGTREAFILRRDSNDAPAGMAFRCLRAAGKTTGAIGFEGLEDQERMAGPVAALAGNALDRASSIRHASRAAAEAHTETLRSAILDALAHEFKTPLAAILAAAGGLREAAPVGGAQAELADIVETQAARLTSLSSRLLRLARLDREDLKPRLEPVACAALVSSLVDRYSCQAPDRRILLHVMDVPGEVPADAELYELALSQLLENACRYSPAGSTVKVTMEVNRDSLAASVWNSGIIVPSERSLIFERFYRGAEGRRAASGTGLGLHIARKIALAHGGRLELDSGPGDDGVSFCLTIPLKGERLNLAAGAAQNLDCG